jgi:hypothetical protein
MKLKPLNKIKNKEEARQIAVEYQFWASNQSLSYSELATYGHYFELLGRKFHLIKEFKENGII